MKFALSSSVLYSNIFLFLFISLISFSSFNLFLTLIILFSSFALDITDEGKEF